MKLLLQVFVLRFEKLHVLMLWSEDMDVLRIKYSG